MAKFPRLAAAVCFCFLAPVAHADVTAADVWESWQDQARTFGQTLNASGAQVGSGTLTQRRVTLEMETVDGTVESEIGDIVFTESGSGAVAITLPDSYPLTLRTAGDAGEDLDLTMQVRHPGLEIVATGEPGAVNYTLSSPELGLELTEIALDGTPFDMVLEVLAKPLQGSYGYDTGGRTLVNDLELGALAVRMEVDDPEGGGAFELSMTMEDVRSDGRSTGGSALAGTMPLSAMLDQGFRSTSAISYGAVRYAISGTDTRDTFNVDGSIGSGRVSADINPSGFSYSGSNDAVVLNLSGTSIPFPSLEISLEESSGTFQMPLAPSDEPQDFALLTELTGLEIDEMLWSLFDPQALLPREPANLLIDIAGRANWLVDITDPEAAEGFDATMGLPGELHALDLNALSLSLLGAKLAGEGAFTFDNSGASAFAEMPAPDGTVEFELTGLDNLLDTLVSMGLVPEDQAMGARMMLGIFAQPGPGPDSLVSTIEVNPDGSVLANGQRIR